MEVVNLGIGGFGLVQELHWLRYRLDRGLDPDLVILAVTVATDLSDSIREEAALAAREAGLPLQRPRLSALDRTKSFLGRHLHAYTWLADRADWLLVRTGLRELAEGESLEILQVPETAAMARGWKLAGRTLGEFAALARDRTFDLVVMLVPMRHQILPGDWERLRRYHLSLEGTPLDQADLDHPSRRLAALCAEQDLPLLDLTGPFRASPRRDRLYFGRDPHWDVAGHREAASLLAGWIRHRWSPWGAAVRGGGEAKMEEGAE